MHQPFTVDLDNIGFAFYLFQRFLDAARYQLQCTGVFLAGAVESFQF